MVQKMGSSIIENRTEQNHRDQHIFVIMKCAYIYYVSCDDHCIQEITNKYFINYRRFSIPVIFSCGHNRE